jgi:hypothetical protein
MPVDSIFDAYMVSVGLYVMSIIWDLFVSLGLWCIPFAVIFGRTAFQSVLSANHTRTPGGNVNALWFVIFIAIINFYILVLPLMPVQISSMSRTAGACASAEETYGASMRSGVQEKIMARQNVLTQAADGGVRELHVPVFLYYLMNIGHGVKAYMVAELPCKLDLRFVVEVTQNQKLQDPLLKAEVGQFVSQCYEKALGVLRKEGQSLEYHDDWAGSKHLLDNYYDNASGLGFYAQQPIQGFSTSANKLPDYPTEQLPPGYGFPTCKEWWVGANGVEPYVDSRGLSTRLFGSLESWLKENDFLVYAKLYSLHRTVDEHEYGGLNINAPQSAATRTASRDMTLKQSYFTTTKLNEFAGTKSLDYGGLNGGDVGFFDGLARGVAVWGAMWDIPKLVAGSSMLRAGMPMVKSVILMLLIILYLPICALTLFSFVKVGKYGLVIVSLLIWPFWFELGRMLDDNMSEVMGIDWKEPTFSILNIYLIEGFYLYIPLAVTSILSAFGVMGLPTGEMTRMVSPAASAANNAAGKITEVVKGAVEAGANLATGGKIGAMKGALNAAKKMRKK